MLVRSLSRLSGQAALALHRQLHRRLASWAGSSAPPYFEEADLSEKFVKGWGCGGQGVNKSSNAVILTHTPTKEQIRCHKHRALSDNRKEARSILTLRLDTLLHGQDSKTSRKQARTRRSKAQAARRAKAKYGGGPGREADTEAIQVTSPIAESPREGLNSPQRQSHADSVKAQLQHLLS